MSWVQLRVEDVLAAALGTLETFTAERQALLDHLTEQEMFRWFVLSTSHAAATKRAAATPAWRLHVAQTDPVIERVQAVRKACEMSATDYIWLNLTDFQLIRVGDF